MAYPVEAAARAMSLGLSMYVLSICLLTSTTAYAQDCTPNDIVLTSQAQVVSFDSDHGPCTNIVGGLFLSNSTFTSLEGLKDITGIGGSFGIDESNVSSMSGLSNLVTIGGGFVINLSSVSSLSGLSNLVDIGGVLSIRDQFPGSFSSFSGLSSLASLGKLQIDGANYLTSLSGMTSLTSLGGIHIFNADALTSLAGLPAGLNMIKNLSIESNDALQTLEGLSPIAGMETLYIRDNPNLTSISALAGSVFNDDYGHPFSFDGRIIPSLGISNNPKLSSLNGVPSILPPGTFQNLYVTNTPLITSLSVLDGAVEIWGSEFGFSRNTALSDCTALVKIIDDVDDGFPGPREENPRDIIIGINELEFLFLDNAPGCASVAEILGSSSDDGVFMDGFETTLP